MKGIDRFTVHERAAASDALKAKGLCFTHGLIGDAPHAKTTVKPDLANPPLTALAHEISSDIRMGCDHQPVDLTRNGSEVGVAPNSLKF